MQGNTIIEGGRAGVTLTSATGTAAYGTVTYSSDPSTLPSGAVTLEQLQGNQLLVQTPSGPKITLCGPQAARSCFGA
jgi:hypothetical protein